MPRKIKEKIPKGETLNDNAVIIVSGEELRAFVNLLKTFANVPVPKDNKKQKIPGKRKK